MRRAAVYGLAVVCLLALFTLSGPEAQKMAPSGGGGGTSSPVPVSVANFPTTQEVRGVVEVGRTVNVTGSVAVTNLPAVQQVAGTVNVGNLPLDADGNVRMSGALTVAPPAQIRFVGFTRSAILITDPPLKVLRASRACQEEFPGTRVCESREISRMTPVPPEPPVDYAWVSLTDPYQSYSAGSVALGLMGEEQAGLVHTSGGTWPVACCGY